MNKESHHQRVERLLDLSLLDLAKRYSQLPPQTEDSFDLPPYDPQTSQLVHDIGIWIDKNLDLIVGGRIDGWVFNEEFKAQAEEIYQIAESGHDRLIFGSLFNQGQILMAQWKYWNNQIIAGLGDIETNYYNRNNALIESTRLYVVASIFAGFKPDVIDEVITKQFENLKIDLQPRADFSYSPGRQNFKDN